MALLHEFSTCNDVLRFAGSRGDRSWTYIILGKVGPTGKTHLCNMLCENGYNAFEISEEIWDLVKYNDNKNHYKIDYSKKQVVIILNKKLPEYIYPGKKNPNPAEFDVNDWLDNVTWYDHRADAEKHLTILKRVAVWYGCVTRADYMDLVGSKPRPIDKKYGWLEHEIKRARIVSGPFGWFIEFPRAIPLLD